MNQIIKNSKIKNTIIPAAAIMATLLVLSSVAAGAATISQSSGILYVDNVNILAVNNATAVPGVTYDSATSTLTLDNATITKGFQVENYAYGICSDKDLNIVLKGNNTIDLTSYPMGTFIMTMGNLTISGDGSLNGKGYFGIDCEKNLVIKDCKVYLETTTFSYFSAENMTFVNCSATGSSSNYWAIVIYGGDLKTENSFLTAKGTVGINSNFGNITFSESSVAASGSEDGIAVHGFITVESGNVSASGNEAAIVATETNANYPKDFKPGKTAVNPFEIVNKTKPEKAPAPRIILSDKVDVLFPENAAIVCSDWTYSDGEFGYVSTTSFSENGGAITYDGENSTLSGAAKEVLIMPHVEKPTPETEEPEETVTESSDSSTEPGTSDSKGIPAPGFALVLAGVAVAGFGRSFIKRE